MTSPYELPYAASILFQGYYLMKAVDEGLDEIVCEGKVVMDKASLSRYKKIRQGSTTKPQEIFNMFKVGQLNATEVYSAACKLEARLSEDTRLKGIFERIGNGDFELSVDDAVYASRRILEGCR
jgi:hypothetical protein